MTNGEAAQGKRSHHDPAPDLSFLPHFLCLWCQEPVAGVAYMMAFGAPDEPDEIFVLHVPCEDEMRRALAHVGAAPMHRYPL